MSESEEFPSSFSTSEISDLEKYPKDDEGYVYVIREKTDEYYKIGITTNPKKRMSDLQTGNPRELIFKRIIKVEDRSRAEKDLHKIITAKGYKAPEEGGQEWFKVPIAEKQWLYDQVEKIKTKYQGQDLKD